MVSLFVSLGVGHFLGKMVLLDFSLLSLGSTSGSCMLRGVASFGTSLPGRHKQPEKKIPQATIGSNYR